MGRKWSLGWESECHSSKMCRTSEVLDIPWPSRWPKCATLKIQILTRKWNPKNLTSKMCLLQLLLPNEDNIIATLHPFYNTSSLFLLTIFPFLANTNKQSNPSGSLRLLPTLCVPHGLLNAHGPIFLPAKRNETKRFGTEKVVIGGEGGGDRDEEANRLERTDHDLYNNDLARRN